MEKRVIYHGSRDIVKAPEIRISRFNKDFYFGFYCTEIREQAKRWATRFGEDGYVSRYEFLPNSELSYMKFEGMTEEWLDFIVRCRSGEAHSFDVVEGPMANDTIFNYIQGFIDGKISRKAFWELAKFNRPTHQLSFHTARALATLTFLEGEAIHGEK